MVAKVLRIEANCERCEKPFLYREKTPQKFCSILCAQAGSYGKTKIGRPKVVDRIIINCEQCGLPFEKLSTSLKKYCSHGCYSNSKKGKGKPLIEPEKRPCEYCGNIFLVGGAGNRPNIAKFCSRSCSRKSYWNNLAELGIDIKRPDMKGISKPAREVEPVFRNCEWCETLFRVNGNGNNSTKRFCSHTCAQESSWSKRRSGDIKNLPGAHNPAKQMGLGQCMWVAGVIDGEGCISWPRRKAVRYFTLSVSNTNKPFLDRLVEFTGTGRITEPAVRNKKHSPIFVWNCNGKNAEEILRQIYPHIIVKKSHADIALGYIEASVAPYSARTLQVYKAAGVSPPIYINLDDLEI